MEGLEWISMAKKHKEWKSVEMNVCFDFPLMENESEEDGKIRMKALVESIITSTDGFGVGYGSPYIQIHSR